MSQAERPPAPSEPPDARWAKDFPIEVGQDNYVARRDFTKFMVLTSFAFVVGQFWIAIKNVLRRRRGQPPIRQIARLDQIPPGGAMTFAYPDDHHLCILVRTSEGSLVAYSQACTHLACAVTPSPESNRLHCPCHEGYFDLSTGRPTAGPPRRPLPRIALDVRGGAVYATGMEVATV